MNITPLPPITLADSEPDYTHTVSVDLYDYGHGSQEIIVHDTVIDDVLGETTNTVLTFSIDDAERFALDLLRGVSLARGEDARQGELFGRAA